MTEKTFTIQDMISTAASGDAAEFQSAFNALTSARAAEAVAAAREEVAKTFTNEVETETEEVTDEDAESVPAA